MTSAMTSDREFETQLFDAFGRHAAEWADDGVTERVLREIDRELQVRRKVMLVSALAGAVLSIGLLAAFAGPLVARAAELAGAPAGVLWTVMLVGAACFSWATARLAVEA